MEIVNTTPEEISKVLELYAHAIAYQRQHGYNVWPVFDTNMIMGEIEANRHWKIINEGEVACVFSVAYEDGLLWGNRECGDAIYLHRIATHPGHKGKSFIKHILNWSIDHAEQLGRKYVRMDTWGDNEPLSNYYLKAGFNFVGKRYIEKNEALPRHYWGIYLNLFEIKVQPATG